MEKQLLAIGFENYSNYIKLPESVLTEFNKPKQSDISDNYTRNKNKNKKHKSINLREQLAFTTDVNILPPYYFSIESTYGKFTYCGVQDFTADEGMVIIPHGILANLDVYGSDFVTVRYIANVPKGDFVQLEPIQREIFDIPELDKFFEMVISKYCLLYPEQILTCVFDNELFSIKVKSIKSVCEFDVKPELIDIVNTDLKIDIFNRFLEEELKEKEKKRINDELIRKQMEESNAKNQLVQPNSFSGTGLKLGGVDTLDPILMREIRLQKFLAVQEENKIKEQEKQKNVSIETNINKQTHTINQLESKKQKTSKKPKEFDI